MAKDNSIMITAPKMTKLLPLDKYGQPLELPKSKYHNNHEQQIYRLRSRVVGNRQANEKMLGCCKNSWPPEKNIKQVC
jgi:hypothetical protein